jgi:hypothetical protein
MQVNDPPPFDVNLTSVSTRRNFTMPRSVPFDRRRWRGFIRLVTTSVGRSAAPLRLLSMSKPCGAMVNVTDE